MPVSRDLEWMVYGITVRRVVRLYPLSGYTAAGHERFIRRFVFRARIERLRLMASVARGDLDFMA